jgi:large subunit ribosomal protein L4e
MKTKLVDLNKSEKGSKELPVQFTEQVRDDLIQRSVLSIEAEGRQAYGTTPRAGLRHVADEVSRRRRDYKTSYGHGLNRIPRKILSRNGTQMNWVGATAPGTVGGRAATPPKSNKIWSQKVNVKENRKAIRSAIAATVIPALVEKRGHKIPKDFPFIIDNKAESLSKTKDVERTLEKLGFTDELARASKRKVRSGSGKNRGRKYQRKVGPLFVVGGDCPLLKAAQNIPGVDVVIVQNLNAKLLAPGCHPGRLTLWTENAIDALAHQRLFTEGYEGPKQEKKVVEIKQPMKVAKAPKKEVHKAVVKKEERPVEKKTEEKKVALKKEHADVENIMKELKAKTMKKA